MANRTVFINQSPTHFGVLFRANGHFAAFDGETNLTPANSNWAPDGNYSGKLHRFEILCTDSSDGNPFDGSGGTKIEVFIDEGPTPILTYTKLGGYADNYVNLQAFAIGDFDNLEIANHAAAAPILPNRAPVGIANTVAITETQPYTFARADFGFSDPNNVPPNNFNRVKITSIPTFDAGTLSVNGNRL